MVININITINNYNNKRLWIIINNIMDNINYNIKVL